MWSKVNKNFWPFNPGSSSLALMFLIFTDFPLSVAKTSRRRKKLQPSYVKSAAILKTNARGYKRFYAWFERYVADHNDDCFIKSFPFQDGGRWHGRVSISLNFFLQNNHRNWFIKGLSCISTLLRFQRVFSYLKMKWVEKNTLTWKVVRVVHNSNWTCMRYVQNL